jgi:uncharacterized membrane protein
LIGPWDSAIRTMSTTVAMLGEVPLFALLDENERAALAAIIDTVHFARGERIFRRGEPGDALYLVRSGLVQVFVESNEGIRVVLADNGPGDVFGELSLLDGGPRTATAVAVQDTEALVLDRGDLLEMIARYPHAAMDLLAVIAGRLRAADELLRTQVSRNVNVEAEERQTLGQRLADRVASFGGSWPFIILFAIGMLVWVGINSWMLAANAFDPYPYILLNLVLSMLAAVQAPIIMMSQNRQAAKDRIQADLDYRINLKAELEVAHLHKKIDGIWEELQAHLAWAKHQAEKAAQDKNAPPERGR